MKALGYYIILNELKEGTKKTEGGLLLSEQQERTLDIKEE